MMMMMMIMMIIMIMDSVNNHNSFNTAINSVFFYFNRFTHAIKVRLSDYYTKQMVADVYSKW